MRVLLFSDEGDAILHEVLCGACSLAQFVMEKRRIRCVRGSGWMLKHFGIA
ncbi:hypothetical protein F2Q69_00050838 [Brassica cretica]|uniref:Uncharacterized protein n=1 Tax=Brassica cretica TaxID=69181 RepID=A0A8S9PPQ5_BRACR|nr:hypothetical protein F2Q69_00050838 [Brassica cretica]